MPEGARWERNATLKPILRFPPRSDNFGMMNGDLLQHPDRIGEYRILGCIGQGAMGTIYRAEHPRHPNQVALKILRRERLQQMPRARREIQALARISHPGVVRILDSGNLDGLPWYVMDFIEGPTFREYCKQFGGFGNGASLSAPFNSVDLKQMLRIAVRISWPLAYLHGEGIVHRDLKPENILMGADDRPVLVDFGLHQEFGGGSSREQLAPEGGISGTLRYMSPEQIRGRLVDARADLYSLGVVLYEMLVGEPPFKAATPYLLARAHMKQPSVPPSERVGGVPFELDELVLRLLEKDPRDRLGYADDVAMTLRRMGILERPGPDWPRPKPYLYRPALAGRRKELRKLQNFLKRLDSSRGGMLFIGGETGVGKTRLALELSREARRRKVLVLTGGCMPPADRRSGTSPRISAPLALLRNPLRGIADWCRQMGEAETKRVLRQRTRILEPYEPSYADLPGLEEEATPVDLPSRAARDRLFNALREILAAVAEATPVIVLLDDIQWIDELAMEFLERLARTKALDNTPVLLVSTYRPEELDDRLRELIQEAGEDLILLKRLSDREVARIVADMLAFDEPPEKLTAYLAKQSEGNPFFVAEYLQAAVEDGILARDEDSRWQVVDPSESQGDYDPLHMPQSLRQIIERRLQGLREPTLLVASAAAVIGRGAAPKLLGLMTGLDETQLLHEVEELIRRQVLEEQEDGRLRFTHDKIREIAYGRLWGIRYRKLHRAAAQAIEQLMGKNDDDWLGSLGNHWECAGNAKRARKCYLAGARKAIAHYAHQKAEQLYGAYLSLVPLPTRKSLVVRNELATKILEVQGRNNEALAQHRTAERESRQIGDQKAWSLSLLGQGRIWHSLGKLEMAREFYLRALEISRGGKHRQTESKALGNLALVEWETGNNESARVLFEQDVELTRRIGDRSGEGISLGNLGLLHLDENRPEVALDYLEQDLAIAREVGNRWSEGVSLLNIASIHFDRGNLAKAGKLRLEALGIAREIGHRVFEANVLKNLAHHSRLALGDFERSDHLLDTAEAMMQEMGCSHQLASCLCERALNQLARNRKPPETLVQRARRLARIDANPDSAIGREIALMERRIEAFDAGKELHRGELLQELPPPLQDKLLELMENQGY